MAPLPFKQSPAPARPRLDCPPRPASPHPRRSSQKECKCPVHVPDAPGDDGIVIGGTWFARPPQIRLTGACIGQPPTRQSVTYVGLPVQNMGRKKIRCAPRALPPRVGPVGKGYDSDRFLWCGGGGVGGVGLLRGPR